MDLGFLPLAKGSLLLIYSWLSVPQKKMSPSPKSGEPVGRAVTVQIFPSQSMSLGFCLFIHFMRHFSEQSAYQDVGYSHPSAPESLQKGAHYCSARYGMSHDHRLTRVCVLRAHAQPASHCGRKVEEEGLPADGER